MTPNPPAVKKRFCAVHSFAPVLIFFCLTLLYFPHFFTKLYMDLNDIYCQFYSRLAFFQDSIRHHVFPLWNPFVLCGTPDGLDAFSNYSLGHFLAFFLSLHDAWNGAIVLSAFLSGYFVFFTLERHFRLNRDAALLGGFIYLTLSVNVPTENPTFFLPILFVLATEWIRTRRFYWAFLLSIANAWYYLSANPQYVIYSAMFLFAYIMVFLHKCNPKRHKALLVLETLLPFLLTAGLISFHLLRVYQLLLVSHRQRAVGGVINVLLPTELMGMIFPGYSSNSIDPTLNFLPDVVRQGILRKFVPFLRLRFLEAPYVGILPIFLAFSLFLREKIRPVEKFLWGTTICILVYLIFNPLFFFVRYIPVLKDLPVINRIYLVYGFGISLLAAFAFNSIDQCRDHAGRFGKTVKILASSFLVIIFLRLLLWGCVSRWGDFLTSFSTDHALPFILKQKFYMASDAFYRARIIQLITFMKYWASPLNAFYFNPVLILLPALAAFAVFLRGWLSRKFLFIVLMGLIFLDSFFNLRPKTAYSEPSLLPFRQEAATILQDQGLFRVLPLQPVIDASHPPLVDGRQLDTRTIVLRPETNLLYRLQTPEGYRSLIKKRYVDFFQLLAKKDIGGWLLGEIDNVDDYFADMANIRYFITTKERHLDGYDLIRDGEKYRIFKNPDALDRAYVVHQAEVVNDGAKILKLLREKAIDFRKTVLLEDPGCPNGLYGALPDRAEIHDAVVIKKYNANELVLSASLAQDGFLVVTDAC